MNCSHPIEVAFLADYWIGALAPPEEEAVEEHLLRCELCGTRLREVITLVDGVRNLAREGSLRMVVSDAFLKCVAEDGLQVREYALPPGGSVDCTVTAEDDILIAHLAANLRSVKRVDLCLCDENGIEQFRFKDIPLHPGAGRIAFQESITFAKAAPTYRAIVRLVTFDEGGAEHQLSEYTFNHTRSMPGPGAG